MNDILVVRDEGKIITTDLINFAEIPITRLNNKPSPTNEITFNLKVQNPKTGEVEEGYVKIRGDSTYGLPIAIDDDVLLALLSLATEQGFKSEKILCTRYEIVKRLGWSQSGSSYDRLMQSLNRLKQTSILSDLFWDGVKFSVVNMSVIQAYLLEKDVKAREGSQFQNYVVFNTVFWGEIKKKLTKELDFTLYQHLDHICSKRLFRWIDKQFYEDPMKELIRFDFSDLVYNKIQMSKKTTMGTAKIRMVQYCKELILKGVLEDLGEKTFLKESGTWFIFFKKGPFYSLKVGERQLPSWNRVQMELLEKLKLFELSEKERKDLVEREEPFPVVEVKTKKQWLDYLRQKVEYFEARIEIEGFDWIKQTVRKAFLHAIHTGWETEISLERLRKKKEEATQREEALSKAKKASISAPPEEEFDEQEFKETQRIKHWLDQVPKNRRSLFLQDLTEVVETETKKEWIRQKYIQSGEWITIFSLRTYGPENDKVLDTLFRKHCSGFLQEELVLDFQNSTR